ncbi:hypothetical protein BKA62DRAFT_710849 [Auriculariales sp. MPI-PUGE-AT-0066]|nr:hypothetical protein BKA62DRAFT_710849 [Auriculariales sp. MPI-PUGE-AT-0066]
MSTEPPQLPMHVRHEVFGTLLVGTWFNMLLLGFELAELWEYYGAFSTNSLSNHVYIALLVCAEILSTCGACGLAYTYVVIGWGDQAAMSVQNVTFQIYIAGMAAAVFLMHTFLIRRYLVLSKNRIVSALLCALALTALSMAIVMAWGTIHWVNRSDRPKQRPLVTSWGVASIVADASITSAVWYQLNRVGRTVEDSQGLVKRLMRNTLLSGAITAVLALITFILFALLPLVNAGLAVALSIGRASFLTVLYNINDWNRAKHKLNVASIPMNASVSARFRVSRTGRTLSDPDISTRIHSLSVSRDPAPTANNESDGDSDVGSVTKMRRKEAKQ